MLDSLSACVMLLVVGLVAVVVEGDMLSSDQQKELVEYHNKQRDIWAAELGKKSPHVVWDSALAQRSERYVTQSCSDISRCALVYYAYKAENDIDSVLRWFKQSMKDQKRRGLHAAKRSRCCKGHFCKYNSVVNPDATKFGCAVRVGCSVHGRKTTALVCSYDSCRNGNGYGNRK